MAKPEITITLKMDKVMDDYFQIVENLSAIYELIPDWSKNDFNPLYEELKKIMLSWITIK